MNVLLSLILFHEHRRNFLRIGTIMRVSLLFVCFLSLLVFELDFANFDALVKIMLHEALPVLVDLRDDRDQVSDDQREGKSRSVLVRRPQCQELDFHRVHLQLDIIDVLWQEKCVLQQHAPHCDFIAGRCALKLAD